MEKLTDHQRDLIEFANKITPANWYVIVDQAQVVTKSYAVNVIIEFRDSELDWEDEEEWAGAATGPMRLLNSYATANIALKTQIGSILPYAEIVTLIHELAHIAAARIVLRNARELWKKVGIVPIQGHGPAFMQGYRALIHRVNKQTNDMNLIARLKTDLEIHEKESTEGG